MTMDVNVRSVLSLGQVVMAPHRPVLICALRGWFDIADTATTAADLLAPAATAVTVAEIDPDPFFDFTQQRPWIANVGTTSEITWPANETRLARTATDRDLLVLSGVEPHLHWATFCDALTEIASTFGCEMVITLGAHADASPHTRPPIVVGSTSDAQLARRWGLSEPRHQGITGVAGVLLTRLAATDIAGISLRVGVPHYLPGVAHPAASAALVDHVLHVLEIDLPYDLRQARDDARARNDELVAADPQLTDYVRALEVGYDQRAEAAVPRRDELTRQLHELLDDESAGSDDGAGPADPGDDPAGDPTDPPDGGDDSS